MLGKERIEGKVDITVEESRGGVGRGQGGDARGQGRGGESHGTSDVACISAEIQDGGEMAIDILLRILNFSQ